MTRLGAFSIAWASVVFVACAGSGPTSQEAKTCFQTASGVVCKLSNGLPPGATDVDGDGVADPVVCADPDEDEDGLVDETDDVSTSIDEPIMAPVVPPCTDDDSDSDGDDDDGTDDGDEADEVDLPYDIKMALGETYTPIADAFAEKGAQPAAIVSVEMDGGGDGWRLGELQAGTAFVITQEDCDHEGNRDVGRDRVIVTWQTADGSTESDHLDLRYCEE